MAEVIMNFRMEEKLKKEMDAVCQEMGMSMAAAFTLFAEAVSRERRIPFGPTADPFYSASNMAHLRRGIAALNAGRGVEHELVEMDE